MDRTLENYDRLAVAAIAGELQQSTEQGRVHDRRCPTDPVLRPGRPESSDERARSYRQPAFAYFQLALSSVRTLLPRKRAVNFSRPLRPSL